MGRGPLGWKCPHADPGRLGLHRHTPRWGTYIPAPLGSASSFVPRRSWERMTPETGLLHRGRCSPTQAAPHPGRDPFPMPPALPLPAGVAPGRRRERATSVSQAGSRLASRVGSLTLVTVEEASEGQSARPPAPRGPGLCRGRKSGAPASPLSPPSEICSIISYKQIYQQD